MTQMFYVEIVLYLDLDRFCLNIVKHYYIIINLTKKTTLTTPHCYCVAVICLKYLHIYRNYSASINVKQLYLMDIMLLT